MDQIQQKIIQVAEGSLSVNECDLISNDVEVWTVTEKLPRIKWWRTQIHVWLHFEWFQIKMSMYLRAQFWAHFSNNKTTSFT